MTEERRKRTASPTPRVRGEEMWRLEHETHIATCELCDDSSAGAGWHVLLLRDGEILIALRDLEEAQARLHAKWWRRNYVASLVAVVLPPLMTMLQVEWFRRCFDRRHHHVTASTLIVLALVVGLFQLFDRHADCDDLAALFVRSGRDRLRPLARAICSAAAIPSAEIGLPCQVSAWEAPMFLATLERD